MSSFALRNLTWALCALALTLSACSLDSILPDKRIDYKKARTGNTLEVPPDLTKPGHDDAMAVPDISPSGTATYSAYTGERQNVGQVAGSRVLPEQDNVRLEHDGDRFWLVVQGDPAQVWPRVREFWLENGFLLKVDNPTVGIMETNWAENRADIPQGPIRSVIGKVFDSFYSAATRDKFRVRLEEGQKPGTTEIYLTHTGVEEVVQGEYPQTENSIWKPRPRDPELEAEMLKRLMVSLGIDKQRAQRIVAERKEPNKAQAHMVKTADGQPAVELDEPFSRAWRYTGLALDRVGFTVQDRDRAEGLYYVRYEDPSQGAEKKGFLSKLAFWRSDKKPESLYQVAVKSEGSNSRILVRDKDGKADQSETAQRILNLLYEQLK